MWNIEVIYLFVHEINTFFCIGNVVNKLPEMLLKKQKEEEAKMVKRRQIDGRDNEYRVKECK